MASSSVPAIPQPPSTVEAEHFYHGLPSKPVLVARSSTYSWVEPTGPEASLKDKELRPLSKPHLADSWDTAGPAIISYLDSQKVKWTSIDPVRIGYAEDEDKDFHPVVWIGVVPGFLSGSDGVRVACHCRTILKDNEMDDDDDDFHVEIRQSQLWG